MRIIDFIPVGAENAVTGKQLRAVTGLCERKVKALVANARLHGAVICASLENGGYFLPSTPEEAVQYVRMEQKRISSAQRALRAAESYVESVDHADSI